MWGMEFGNMSEAIQIGILAPATSYPEENRLLPFPFSNLSTLQRSQSDRIYLESTEENNKQGSNYH